MNLRPVGIGLFVGLTTVAVLSSVSGCRVAPLADRVDESVEKAKKQIDDSVDRATTRLETSLEKAKADTAAVVEKARASYDIELKNTGAEVDRLREETKKDLLELDRQIQARLDQIRTSALDLVQKTDASVQQRIDQLFTELHRFTTDTLDRIQKLIQPILDMATKIGTAVENGDRHIAEIVAKITPILDSVKGATDAARGALDEARLAIMKVQGKNADGTPAENPWWTRGIMGAMAAAFAAWRASDKKKNGERWKREELLATTKQDVGDLLKSGEYDDEIAGRISSGALDFVIGARLVVLSAQKQLVPAQEGAGPTPGIGRAPSPPPG